MNIYIGIDKPDVDKFKTVATCLTDKIEKEKIGSAKSIKEYIDGKNDICMLFSNRIRYVEECAKNISCEIINVTENLSSNYIVSSLKHVKDIYYLKTDPDILVARLKKRVNLLTEKKRGVMV